MSLNKTIWILTEFFLDNVLCFSIVIIGLDNGTLIIRRQQWPSSYENTPWGHHRSDVIMGALASKITSLTIVCSTVYSGVDQRQHQTSASLAFLRGIHRWPVNSTHKWPVTRKMFPFDDVIMTKDYLIVTLGHMDNNRWCLWDQRWSMLDLKCLRLTGIYPKWVPRDTFWRQSALGLGYFVHAKSQNIINFYFHFQLWNSFNSLEYLVLPFSYFPALSNLHKCFKSYHENSLWWATYLAGVRGYISSRRLSVYRPIHFAANDCAIWQIHP